MDWNSIVSNIVNWATTTGVKIIIALIVLLVSFRVITVVTRKLEKKMLSGKHHLDKTLTSTLMYVLRIALKIIVAICLVGYLGIDTSSLTALIASFGVASVLP